MDICRVAVRLTYRIRLLRQDDGVAAGKARAHRDHRREGMSVDRFLVGACRTGIGMSVVVTVGSPCGGCFSGQGGAAQGGSDGAAWKRCKLNTIPLLPNVLSPENMSCYAASIDLWSCVSVTMT
jgi:hypothetical protein